MSSPLSNTSTVNVETGTRRLDLWEDGAPWGSAGDCAVGIGYSARYLSDADPDCPAEGGPDTIEGAGACAEILVYVREQITGDGDETTYSVEEMATIGDALWENGMWRPDDMAEITYEDISYRVLTTLKEAQEECDKYGTIDQSWAMNLRPQTATTTTEENK